MRFFYFLGRKKFYLQIPIAFVAVIALIMGVLYSLNIYTFHGEALNLPSYYGFTVEEIEQQPNENNFQYILADSIYDSSKKPGSVILQNPLPNSKVKRNRKVYLTIIAKSAEQILMPNLVDLSLRQALGTLKANGLEVNTLHYIPNFAFNAVLAQLHQGDTILPDSLIKKGSKIDLILGNGNNPQKIKVPFLIGKTKKEVHQYIHGFSLNIGEETYLDQNNYGGIYRVYTQFPAFDSDSLLSYGDFISLEYRSDFAFNFEEYIESLIPDTSMIITLDSLMLFNEIDSLNYEQAEYE